jgi:DNA topoisomerase IA
MILDRFDELPFTLGVCKKPDAARRIAHALANSSFKERSGPPLVYSGIDPRNEQFVVCSVIGHLYRLVDAKRNRSVLDGLRT